MGLPQVLVAHDWESARTSIAAYLAYLRPAYAVRAVLPSNLGAALAADPGSVVVCGDPIAARAAHARRWIVLPVEGAHDAIVGIDDDQRTLPNPEFDEMVGALDALVVGSFPTGLPT